MNTKDHAVSGNVSTERALDLALEALIDASGHVNNETFVKVMMARDAINDAIKQARSSPEKPVYHLRQFGDVTKEQIDRYMATGDINPQPAPVQSAERGEPVAFNAGVPLLYPEMKDGETISVEYTKDINWTQATVPDKILSIGNTKPNYNISFHNNGKEVGKLDFNGPALVFTGEAEESAKVFVDWIAQSFAGRLEEERKAEREAIKAICKAEQTEDSSDLWNVCCTHIINKINERKA
jgi:hypothetical protein